MKIEKIQIENFGKLHDTVLSFGDGINVIRGDNESGKSTLHAFIRSMLFGMQRARGRAAKTDLYARYEPEDNPAGYAGSMRFSSGDKTFLLKRNFSRIMAKDSLICETDGEILSVEDGDLDMLLGDIGAALYDNTVSVGQLKCKTDEALGRIIDNYTANYQQGADNDTDLAAVFKKLKGREKQFRDAAEEQKRQMEASEQQIRQRIAYVEQEKQSNQEELLAIRRQIEEQQSRIDRMEQPDDADVRKPVDRASMLQKEKPRRTEKGRQQRADRNMTWKAQKPQRGFLLAAGGLAVLTLCFVAFTGAGWWVKVLLSILAVLICLFLVRMYDETRKRRIREEKEDTVKHGDLLEALKENVRQHRWKATYLSQEIRDHEMELASLDEELGEVAGAYAVPCPEQEEAEALELAARTIRELSGTIGKTFSGQLAGKVSEVMAVLTKGEVRRVTFDADKKPMIWKEEGVFPLHRASTGTVDQVYFALRLAVMEVFVTEERLPMFFDEIFVSYDDKRLARALTLLAGTGRQVLLFTCQDREEHLLGACKIPFHKVTLCGGIRQSS